MSEPRGGDAGKGSFLEALKAVGWAFFGVRRRDAHESDAVRLKPVQVIVVGLLCAAVFVGALLLIVNLVVGASR